MTTAEPLCSFSVETEVKVYQLAYQGPIFFCDGYPLRYLFLGLDSLFGNQSTFYLLHTLALQGCICLLKQQCLDHTAHLGHLSSLSSSLSNATFSGGAYSNSYKNTPHPPRKSCEPVWPSGKALG